MHKPFKKTHQNIRKDKDDVQSRAPEERGGGFFSNDSMGKVDEELEMQCNNVFALLILYLTISFMVNNKTQVSSFKPWTRCLLMTSTAVCSLQKHTVDQHDALGPKINTETMLTGWFKDRFLAFFLRGKCQFCCRNSSEIIETFISLMIMKFWGLIKWTG